MGQDKALLQLDGQTLVERGLRKLREVCVEVRIAGGLPQLTRFAPVISDSHPGCGPLGGIVAALEQSTHEWNLFLAVDMPFVPASSLRTLLADASGPAQIVLAQAEGRVQPLCGAYSRGALPALREELRAGRLKVKEAVLSTGNVRYVTFTDLSWFDNLNTPEEYRQAAKLSSANSV
jgi:molybdopterin-guanine dinucleotide biosynthesis protein A